MYTYKYVHMCCNVMQWKEYNIMQCTAMYCNEMYCDVMNVCMCTKESWCKIVSYGPHHHGHYHCFPW